MLRHLGPVSLFSKVRRHQTSWPGSQSVTSAVLVLQLRMLGPVGSSTLSFCQEGLGWPGQQHAYARHQKPRPVLTSPLPPQLLILNYSVSHTYPNKGGRGRGRTEKGVWLHLKKGRGEPHASVQLIHLPSGWALCCC